MNKTRSTEVMSQALWPGPDPEMFESVAALAASEPRAELFMYASRSETRCSSDGEGVGDEEGGLAPVWARSGEQIAMAATKKRIRIIAELFRRSSRWKRKDYSTTLTIDSPFPIWST